MEKYGKWEVVKKLGGGGQGLVYLAKDTEKGGNREDQIRRVKNAIKTLASASTVEAQTESVECLAQAVVELSGKISDLTARGALKSLHKPRGVDGRGGYEKAKERMAREVEGLSKINHPHLLRILDQSVEGGWFVGEYHPNGPLSNHPTLFKGNIAAALRAFRPLVEGVAMLHREGMLHRDIKPANIFVAQDGRLVLGDLGIVLFLDQEHTRITESYENVGTRDWMPQWAMGRRIDNLGPESDIFALGKLLWAMLSGRTLLPLWYHHKPEYELERIFPKDDSIVWARVLLDKCIVEEEKDCLGSADSLLRLIDDALEAVSHHAQVVAEGVKRKCRVCGFGSYAYVVDGDKENYAGKFGLRPDVAPIPTFKIFACSYCGHAQIFYIPQSRRPQAWIP